MSIVSPKEIRMSAVPLPGHYVLINFDQRQVPRPHATARVIEALMTGSGLPGSLTVLDPIQGEQRYYYEAVSEPDALRAIDIFTQVLC